MNVLHYSGPDDYLTPPDLVEALGPFDLDPCCHPWMPWRTARDMHSLHPEAWADANVDKDTGVRPEPPYAPPDDVRFCLHRSDLGMPAFLKPQWGDGLQADWQGKRVFLNHPYSDGMPWARKMAESRFGTMLCTPKAVDTAWFQTVLAAADRVYLMAGRLLFHRPTGERTKGKWLPNCLMAFGAADAARLGEFVARHGKRWPGRLLRGC